MRHGRHLPLPEVERVALQTYRWRRFVDDARSSWVTVRQTAGILGVSRQRVKQLLEADRLPYEVGRGGVTPSSTRGWSSTSTSGCRSSGSSCSPSTPES